ncbi:Acetyl-CoA carboxylase 2 [Glycine soja]
MTRCYECGYYVMHWMWNIITSEIKSDWSMWFANETPLDIDNITTIRKKWTTYFLKTAKAEPFTGSFPVLGPPTAISGKVHHKCSASLNVARMILSGYDHNIDEVSKFLTLIH